MIPAPNHSAPCSTRSPTADSVVRSMAVERLADVNCADGRRPSSGDFGPTGSGSSQRSMGSSCEGPRVGRHPPGPAPVPCAGWWEDTRPDTVGPIEHALRQLDRVRGGMDGRRPTAIGGRPPTGRRERSSPVRPVLHPLRSRRRGGRRGCRDARTVGMVSDDWLDVRLIEPVPVTAASRSAGLFVVGSRCWSDRSTNLEGLLVVLDAETGAEVVVIDRPAPVTAVAFGDDGRPCWRGR